MRARPTRWTTACNREPRGPSVYATGAVCQNCKSLNIDENENCLIYPLHITLPLSHSILSKVERRLSYLPSRPVYKVCLQKNNLATYPSQNEPHCTAFIIHILPQAIKRQWPTSSMKDCIARHDRLVDLISRDIREVQDITYLNTIPQSTDENIFCNIPNAPDIIFIQVNQLSSLK